MVTNMKISEMKIGTNITDSNGTSFLIAEKKSPDYKGIILISEKVIAMMPFDKPKEEYEDRERRRCGSNDYCHSDLHKWLNSQEGFLGNLSKKLQDNIVTSRVPYCMVEGAAELFETKVFIPSCEELGLDVEDHAKEGHRLSLFRDFRQRYAFPDIKLVENRPVGFDVLDKDDTWCYWLRSSHPKHGSIQYTSHSHSPYAFCEAYREYVGVRCMIAVNSDMEIDQDGKGGRI